MNEYFIKSLNLFKINILMKHFFYLGTLIFICSIFSSCYSSKKTENVKTEQKEFIPGPKAIIYQTNEDYSKLVPVILNSDKKSIQSYPDIKDVYNNGSLAYPTQLHKGYWLDNRGINKNVAFLSLTYEEYSKLPITPSPAELFNMINDFDPLITMYDCGLKSSYQYIGKELNTKIDSDDFSSFKRIK
jgi:hypothetical protein